MIIIDEIGKYYILTVAGIEYMTDNNTDEASLSHFIVKLNDEHAKLFDIGKFGDFDSLCKVLDSIGLTEKINKLFEDMYSGSTEISFDDLGADWICEIFVYLTRIK